MNLATRTELREAAVRNRVAGDPAIQGLADRHLNLLRLSAGG